MRVSNSSNLPSFHFSKLIFSPSFTAIGPALAHLMRDWFEQSSTLRLRPMDVRRPGLLRNIFREEELCGGVVYQNYTLSV